MDVLLAAKYVPSGPRPIGGVQSWIATVRAELERRGHRVHEWQPGMQITRATFDLGILANMARTGGAAASCRRTICVSHGIISEEEPGPADLTFFVSEGVRTHWCGTGPILRQPIDLAFWRSEGVLTRSFAVRFSYRTSLTLCPEAAAMIGPLPYFHLRQANPAAARMALCGARIVFASGRAALEAMACGAPTVIYDHRNSYQGPLLATDLARQMRESYSGRGGTLNPTLAQVVRAAEGAQEARAWVERHHDVRSVVSRLLVAL